MFSKRTLLKCGAFGLIGASAFALLNAQTAQAASPSPTSPMEPSRLPMPLPPGGICPVPVVAPRSDLHKRLLRYGIPSHENLILYERYMSSSDFHKRIPNWVLEVLTNEDFKSDESADRKNSRFLSETEQIPEQFRASNSDYMYSGWSRGHMVPAGNNVASQSAMNETFILGSNIVPQNQQNNGNFWFRLEKFIKEDLTRKFQNVWVITGPLFLPQWEEIASDALPPIGGGGSNLRLGNGNNGPSRSPTSTEIALHNAGALTPFPSSDAGNSKNSSPSSEEQHSGDSNGNKKQKKKRKYVKYEVIGENNVAVPTHLFKVILAEPKFKTTKSATGQDIQVPEYPRPLIAAFVVPNRPIPPNQRLLDYLVPVSWLEKHAGFVFFNKLNKERDTVHMCDHIECRVMSESELEVYLYPRRILGARNRGEVEKVMQEIYSKGAQPDERTRRAYSRKLKELERES